MMLRSQKARYHFKKGFNMRNHKEVEAIRKKYPIGTRIKLIEMKDKWPVPPGTCGTVNHVDDDGQIHVDWECSSSLALDVDVDRFHKIGSYEMIHADALTVDADVIVHQTNCKGVMGAGIAKQVRDQFPDVFKKYKALCDKYRYHTYELLGACQFVEENGKTICNAFGQDGFNKPGCNTDYIALRECLKKIAKRYSEKTVALPYKIGCGLARGDWFIVETMIRDELVERGHCRVLVCQWP